MKFDMPWNKEIKSRFKKGVVETLKKQNKKQIEADPSTDNDSTSVFSN